MWDAFRFHDIRFLAYPFLFYHDPFRALFSGTILHFFGPSRLLVRLPSIFFSLMTYWFLVYIMKKEKVPSLISFPTLAAFILSGITMNGRLAGGDAQTRFFILSAGYWLLQSWRSYSLRSFFFACISICVGIFTMLNTIVFLPAFLAVFVLKKYYKNIWMRIFVFSTAILFILYFFVWAYLPIQAYKSGFQNFWDNRGLWYYIGRVGEGTSGDPLKSIRALSFYTSFFCMTWILCTALYLPVKKNFRFLALLVYPALFSVLFLNRPSFHILMYFGVLFLCSILIMNWAWKHVPNTHVFLLAIVALVLLGNEYQLLIEFLSTHSLEHNEFIVGHLNVSRPLPDLDEAVVRIYSDHGQKPLETP
jgi:hypothetical protein